MTARPIVAMKPCSLHTCGHSFGAHDHGLGGCEFCSCDGFLPERKQDEDHAGGFCPKHGHWPKTFARCPICNPDGRRMESIFQCRAHRVCCEMCGDIFDCAIDTPHDLDAEHAHREPDGAMSPWRGVQWVDA